MFDIAIFIQSVRRRPALYSPNHEDYNKKEVRMRLWDEIGLIMFTDWMSLDEKEKRSKLQAMQRKWKSLKDCFNREVRQRKTGDPQKNRKQYEFYNRLSFLLDKKTLNAQQVSLDVTEVMIKEETPKETELNSSNRLPCNLPVVQEMPIIVDAPPLRKRKAPEEEAGREVRIRQEKRREGEEDSDRLFLMSFVNDLRMMPLSTKYWVKMKFSEIMHQATMSLDGLEMVEYEGNCYEDGDEGGTDCGS